MNKFEYKELTPFKWYVLQNFPFIEADFDMITEYQLYCKVVEYLNNTINNMNLTGQQMENVTNAMTELQNYLNEQLELITNNFDELKEYVENLDLQEEVNIKLNELVENGTLENIISNYINKIYYDFVNVKSFGAVGDGVADDTNAIINAINFIKENFNSNNNTPNTLYFPTGTYKISNTIEIPNIITLKTNGNVIIDTYFNGICFLFNNTNIQTNNNNHYIGEKINGNFTFNNKNTERGNTIAIQFQTEESLSGVENFNSWNEYKNININNYHIGINLIMKNLFIKTFSNVIITKCDYGIYFNSQISNSGERITFEKLTIGDSDTGIYVKTSDLELNIINSSIDFTNKCITISDNGVIVKLTNCHFEGIGYNNDNTPTDEQNPYLYKNNNSYYSYAMLMLTNCDYMTVRNTLIQSGLNGTNVFLKGVVTKGSSGFNKLYALCDDNCNIITNEFLSSIYLQMIIQNKQNQKIEPNFENIENQNITDNQTINGYTFSTNISGKTSITDERYLHQGKSIKYNIPTGGAYFEITSEEYNVIPFKKLSNLLYYYYQGSANKGIRLSMKTTFYDKDNNILPYPTNSIDAGVNYINSTANEWNRPFQFEQCIIPANAVKAKTKYIINPVTDGLLYLTNFYRTIN